MSAAEINEALLESVMIDILSSDDDLEDIPPRSALAEDDEEKGELSLTVQATLQGREIQILAEYEVTITLERTFRQEESDQEEMESLWLDVLEVIQNPPVDLDIYDEVNDLRFDEIEVGSSSGVSEGKFSRSITFRAWMRPA